MKDFCLSISIITIFLFSSNTFAQLPSDPGNDPIFQSHIIKSSRNNSSVQIDENVQNENEASPQVKKVSTDSPKQKNGSRQKSKQKAAKRNS